MSTPILVAVAWPYASGSRHLGHLAGAYLPADVFARYQRLIGNTYSLRPGERGIEARSTWEISFSTP